MFMCFVTCYPFIAKEEAKIWEGLGTPAPSLKNYRSMGMYTLLLVCSGVWLVESMSWVHVYADADVG